MSKNDHTGKDQKTPVQTDKYRENWEKIFGKKDEKCGKHS
jgi:hypothetical protein